MVSIAFAWKRDAVFSEDKRIFFSSTTIPSHILRSNSFVKLSNKYFRKVSITEAGKKNKQKKACFLFTDVGYSWLHVYSCRLGSYSGNRSIQMRHQLTGNLTQIRTQEKALFLHTFGVIVSVTMSKFFLL